MKVTDDDIESLRNDLVEVGCGWCPDSVLRAILFTLRSERPSVAFRAEEDVWMLTKQRLVRVTGAEDAPCTCEVWDRSTVTRLVLSDVRVVRGSPHFGEDCYMDGTVTVHFHNGTSVDLSQSRGHDPNRDRFIAALLEG